MVSSKGRGDDRHLPALSLPLHRGGATSPSAADIKFGETVSSIIEEDVPSVREKKARAATFSNAEAEYAMKLVRVAESSSENEAAIASRKLDQFAADHGMNAEELRTKA